MGLKNKFILLHKGKDITVDVMPHVKRIEVKDEYETLSDELIIELSGAIKRPFMKDEYKLKIIPENKKPFNVGTFAVQTTTRANDTELTVIAHGMDFSSSLKTLKSRTWEKLHLSKIVSMIAKEHDLKVVCDFKEDVFIEVLQQTNEHDLYFLRRLAGDYDAIFSVKFGRVLFVKRDEADGKKNKTKRPAYIVNKDELSSWSIQHANKTWYQGVRAVWKTTERKQFRETLVGIDAAPVFRLEGSFLDEAEARRKGTAKLSRLNRGIRSGRLTLPGKAFTAGGILNLVGTLDDGEYTIKAVNHRFTPSGGWQTAVTLES